MEVDVIICRNVLMYLNDDCAAKCCATSVDVWPLTAGCSLPPPKHRWRECADLTPANLPGLMAFRKGAVDLSHNRFPASAVKPAARIHPAGRGPIIQKTAAKQRPRGDDAAAAVAHDANCDSVAQERLVREYANQGDLNRALACCEQLISAEKLNPRIRYLHAMILQEQGDLAQAAVSFRRSIYLDSEFIMAHVGAGQLALRLGNHKEADQHLRRATRLLKRLTSGDGP